MVQLNFDDEESTCGCEAQVTDKGLCYVEGVMKDYTGEDLHENVWFSMRPPKHVGTSSHPYVSARTIEVTRAELTGSASVHKPIPEAEAPSKDTQNLVGIEKRKAGVKFITEKHS